MRLKPVPAARRPLRDMPPQDGPAAPARTPRPAEAQRMVEVRPAEAQRMVEVRPTEAQRMVEVRPADAQRMAETRPSDVRGGEGRPSDVRGAVDNASSDRLYGWAWDAGNPGARLRVELRLAGEVVANTVADFVRPDLARSGVGDGCHAFEFPLVPSWIERRGELTAVAYGVDGIEVPIPMRLRRAEEAPPTAAAQIVRALEALQGEQSGLRAELQAMQARTEDLPDHATVAAMRHAQDELHRKVEQLELWLTRLDARLSEADLGGAADRGGRLDVWQAALIAVLASAASAACAVTAARFVMAG